MIFVLKAWFVIGLMGGGSNDSVDAVHKQYYLVRDISQYFNIKKYLSNVLVFRRFEKMFHLIFFIKILVANQIETKNKLNKKSSVQLL